MKLRIMILCLSLIALFALASCGKQANDSNTAVDSETVETTEENLPEYTGTQDETETDATKEEGSSELSKEESTEFSGLDVQETTEIELEEGQDVEVY